MFANIFDGIMNAISMGSLFANLMGVVLGIIFGALPGLTAAMGVAPLLAKAAMSFGAAEYFAVAVFGLTVVASLSSGKLVKGLISALVGLFLATIGIDPVTGDMRNTFDNPNLFNGLSLVPVLVGLFAMSQVLVTVEDVIRGVSLKEGTVSKRGLSLRDLTSNTVNFIRSSVIGTLIGIIPATGVSAATFLAYSEAKRFSKTPEKYGKGCLEGIAATESSNNAVCGGALIPLLTLGVPGDIITAIMLGALMIQGLTPGPLLFVEHPVTVYGIFAAFIIANVLMLVCGLIAVRGAGKIIAIPGAVLMPIVITLCVVGGYAVNSSTFDLLVVAIFGTVGYLMIKCDFPQPPLLLAMILEPIAESNFRRALSISQNDYSIFYTSPVACIILGVSLLVLLKPIYDDFRASRKAAA